MIKYCVTFKTPTSELVTVKYDSPLDRALAIISLNFYWEVIREWNE